MAAAPACSADRPSRPLDNVGGQRGCRLGRLLRVRRASLQVFADGAAYDPATDRWRPLAPAPIAGRHAHDAVWTGEELLVFGGLTATGTSREAAAYRPDRDQWRRLADLPFPRAHGQTVWTGRQALSALGSDITEESLTDVITYDPTGDRWHVIPGHHVAAGTAVWTGTQVLTIGQDPTGARPASWSWRP